MPKVSKIGLVRTSYFVYIMTNKSKNVLYSGVTNDLQKRCLQHINKEHPESFTALYNVHKLVYYEQFGRIEEAIAREKQIKAGSRKKKIELIEKMNPGWKDLFEAMVVTWD